VQTHATRHHGSLGDQVAFGPVYTEVVVIEALGQAGAPGLAKEIVSRPLLLPTDRNHTFFFNFIQPFLLPPSLLFDLYHDVNLKVF